MLPTGRLLYLEADQPSERTTTLRGLYLVTPDGQSKLIIHETEPQDSDAGVRVWIGQPSVSPDGHFAAYVRQDIVLQEEKQSEQTDICVISLDAPMAKPNVIFDVTGRIKKQVVGLTWSLDSQSVAFMADASRYSVARAAPYKVTVEPLSFSRPIVPDASISCTQSPQVGTNGTFSIILRQGNRQSVVIGNNVIDGVRTYALSHDGTKIAFVPAAHPTRITVASAATGNPILTFKAKFGWSIFGKRQIDDLKWSPDGTYLAYGVSKLPVPDDEIFYVDLATGAAHIIPERSGQMSWTWAPAASS